MDRVFYCLDSLMKPYMIYPNKVIHVGGGKCEELISYINIGFKKITYIDPLFDGDKDELSKFLPSPRLDRNDCREIEIRKIKAAISIKNETRSFYKTKFQPGSSLYQPLLHEVDEIIAVECIQLKDIEEDDNVLVVDAQGAEYFVLLSSNLNYDLIIVEENTIERYRNNVSPLDVANLMKRNNFELVASFPHGNHGMQDNVYVKVKK